MKRFFFKEKQREGNIVVLTAEESHHVRKVLRLQQGQEVELLDGTGSLYRAVIAEKDGPCTVLHIISETVVASDAGSLVVAPAVIKPKKMELILQKCTEIGVDRVAPVVCARSQGNLVQQGKVKEDRFQKIIEESCKQCRRCVPLVMETALPFDEIVRKEWHGDKVLRLLFWEQQGSKELLAELAQEIRDADMVVLLFGPEGGFSKEEVQHALAAGWRAVGLGSLILRAETAVIAASVIVQHLRGLM